MARCSAARNAAGSEQQPSCPRPGSFVQNRGSSLVTIRCHSFKAIWTAWKHDQGGPGSRECGVLSRWRGGTVRS